MKIDQEHGKIILRISLSLVFLWFGINQLYAPANWTSLVPEMIAGIISPGTVVVLNGSLEVILGLMLITGIYVRPVALILSAHLLGIAFSLGNSPTAIRDYGLTFATLSIFFLGADKWSIDKKFN